MIRDGVKAKISPSGVERWLECTAAPWLEATQAKIDMAFNEEGTFAHAAAELLWNSVMGMAPQEFERRETALRKEIADAGFDAAGMFAYATRWQNAVRAINDEYWTDWLFLAVEHGVELSDLDPALRGRIDFFGVFDGLLGVEMIISDLKYGQGVRVPAENNPQQMLYAYGAFLSLPKEIQHQLDDESTVHIQLAQVRVEDGVQTWETTLGEIREWVDSKVAPALREIEQGGNYRPGKHCQFCLAAGACRARGDAAAAALGVVADLLTPEETAAWLDQVPTVRGFCKALEDRALREILQGREIPGWGVKRSAGQRKIVDTEEAIDRLVQAGYRQSDVSTRKVNTLGSLESLVGGKDELGEILGDVLIKSQGSLKLAKGATSALAVDPAEVFGPPVDDEDE